ncbi:hypothetical protein NMY22_g2540 [Coprinellus aureogranulatus]|nr:hypothetical protein NMY22_g2540 [Coprinellus aureogranulatus]
MMPSVIRISASLPSLSSKFSTMAFSTWDTDSDTCDYSSSCSDCSFEEETVNSRIQPRWVEHRQLFEERGYYLETVKDARAYYRRIEESSQDIFPHNSILSILCSEEGSSDDDELCPDAGLPDNLFRGTKASDGKKFVAKAVNSQSREYEIVRLLSSPPLRDDPMNHTIRESSLPLSAPSSFTRVPPAILDIFECAEDRIAFIVMEEWSSQLIPASGGPCCPVLFLDAVRQWIEHITFMHRHHIAHLDISLRNLVTDFNGHYAYIDFELSRNFDGIQNPRIFGHHATEVPPECDSGGCCDPFQVDVWALGALLQRICQMLEHDIPELVELSCMMMNPCPESRPRAKEVLAAFDDMVAEIRHRIPEGCSRMQEARH